MKFTRLIPIFCFLFFGEPPAMLATAIFTVSNLNDSGPGSLRQALLDLNAHGPGTIRCTLTGNISVQTELPSIQRNLQFSGPSTGTLSLRAHSAMTNRLLVIDS